MKYKFEKEDPEHDIPSTVQFGEVGNIPDYNFKCPEEFIAFGLWEFMEGVFEFPGKTEDQVRAFLAGLDYQEEENKKRMIHDILFDEDDTFGCAAECKRAGLKIPEKP